MIADGSNNDYRRSHEDHPTTRPARRRRRPRPAGALRAGPDGGVQLQVREQPAGGASDERRAPRRWPTPSAPTPRAASTIEIFPNNQLGSDTDMLSQVRSGGIEFFTLSGLILVDAGAGRLDHRHRLRLQRLRRGVEGAWTATSAPMCAKRDRQVGPGARWTSIWDNGFRQITSSTKPINTAGRPEGLQDPRPGLAAVDLDVQGLRAPRRPRSTSARSTPRCRPRSSTARKIRWPSSPRPSSTKCRSTARSPTTCGTASGSWPTARPGSGCPPTCAPSSPGTSTTPA